MHTYNEEEGRKGGGAKKKEREREGHYGPLLVFQFERESGRAGERGGTIHVATRQG